eukprot:m.1203233 g.1203233  ORF g.1203233 m.1203233 type:complete len:492 (+) comp24578_c0_seq8:3-1478(+)
MSLTHHDALPNLHNRGSATVKAGSEENKKMSLTHLQHDANRWKKLRKERLDGVKLALRNVDVKSRVREIEKAVKVNLKEARPRHRRHHIDHVQKRNNGILQFNPATCAVDVHVVDDKGYEITKNPIQPERSSSGASLNLEDVLLSSHTAESDPGYRTATVYIFARCTSPRVLLHTQRIRYRVQNQRHARRPRITIEERDRVINFASIPVTLEFLSNRGPVRNAKVSGDYVPRNHKERPSTLQGMRTNINGQVEVCLPAGYIKGLQAVTGNGECVTKKGNLVVSERQTGVTTKTVIDCSSDLNRLTSMFDLDSECSILFLCDTSLSMENNDRIGKAKKCMTKMLPDAVAKCERVFVGVWNSSTHVYPQSVTHTRLEETMEWIANVQCTGCTFVEQAITGALTSVGDVTDVYILTDGLLADWQYSQEREQLKSWAHLRNLYPDTAFHFAAIGEARATTLQTMANIGGGNFYENFCDSKMLSNVDEQLVQTSYV